jgi:hypothetical protein
MTGEVEEVEGGRLLEFAGIKPMRFRIYPIESHVAEKLHAYTLPRARPNSRVKDLPDLALLATARALRGVVLRTAIQKTFEARATHAVPGALPPAPPAWGPIYERMVRIDNLRWRTLEELHQAVGAFLDPILAGRGVTWNPKTWRWIGPGTGPTG